MSQRPKRDSSRSSGLPRLYEDDDAAVREEDTFAETATYRTDGIPTAPLSSHLDARPTLTVTIGIDAGKIYTLDSDEVLLGRAPDCQVELPDRGVSRHHARLIRRGTTWVVADCGSRNGTFVSGTRVDQAELAEHAAVQIGSDVVLRFAMLSGMEIRLARQLYDSSMRDALTRTFNRHYFIDRVRSELAFAQRHRTLLSVVVFDLDHFKRINDAYGHAAGDEVLRDAAAAIQARLRSEDVFARLGGEEFAVLLRGVPHKDAVLCAERAREALAGATFAFDAGVRITASFGVASIDDLPARWTLERLLAVADERLYRAKAAGRNRTCGREPLP